jgi:hypothetical protein
MEPADDMQLEAFAEEGHGWASEAVALAQVRLIVVKYCCCWCVQLRVQLLVWHVQRMWHIMRSQGTNVLLTHHRSRSSVEPF